MREQIKELCLFMICGQTLLYFQSGKKYEKICRMILELLVLAGIVGMILNFLQSFGIQKGEMQALGGAVAGMQRSMEEALERQLDMDGLGEDLMSGISMEGLVEKYTMEEIRSRYGYFAEQYGYEIVKVEQKNDRLQVFLKARTVREQEVEKNSGNAVNEIQGDGGLPEEIANVEEVRPIEIEKIEWGENSGAGSGEGAETEAGPEKEKDAGTETKAASEKDTDAGIETVGDTRESKNDAQQDAEQLEAFRRQLALAFAMEEEKLEVILID